MGFLARGLERKASSLDIWAEMLRIGRTSKTGVTINLENAIRVSALFACLRVLSQGAAQVPFKLFRETTVGGLTRIEAARDHYLYDKMTSRPNDWQTSYEFREQLVIHAALGNAYAWKNIIPGGKVAELILLDPGRMVVEQPNEVLPAVYKYTFRNGRVWEISPEQVWHVRGPSWTGFAGLEVLTIAREALGLSIATEDSHAKLHANGVRPSGVYSFEGVLSKEQQAQAVKWLKAEAGAEAAGNPLVLDRSAKWLSQTMTGVDAQHLETRRMQIEEVCRFVGVSPHKIYSSDKTSTYASAEQFNIQHVVDSLSPWYARIEQSADINLLTDKERASGLYFKFMAAGLLRGALKDQGEFFAKMLGAGGTRQVLTQDEIRALLEFNPIGGEASELHAPTGAQAPGEPA